MPWKLFEALYESHAKRKAVDRCINLKEAIVGGLWSNSNYDPEKKGAQSPREQALKDVEDRFATAIAKIRGHKDEAEYRDGIDQADPFFSAMRVPKMDDEVVPVAEKEDEFALEFDQG